MEKKTSMLGTYGYQQNSDDARGSTGVFGGLRGLLGNY
jgi:hypothetical protein